MKACHMANDLLTDWWMSREEVRVSLSPGAGENQANLLLAVSCPWPEGCTLRLPGQWEVQGPAGSPARLAGNATFVCVPAGDVEVAVSPAG